LSFGWNSKKNKKTQHFGNQIYFHLQVGEGDKLTRRDIAGKYAVQIVMKHARTWNYDTHGGESMEKVQ
jgi:hypothetical protein